ncbi:MAG: excinuclease ABC subunit UvrA, partial [Planctomycetota bacterium]
PVFLLAPLVENRKGEFKELLHDLKKRGFVRLRHNGEIVRLEGLRPGKRKKHTLELVVDRLNPAEAGSSRMTDSVETALREGKGTVVAESVEGGDGTVRLSQNRSCNACSIGLPELSPQSFSFNSPLGMCPACNGLGRRTEMDPDRVVPDKSLSILEGAIKPWAKVLTKADSWNSKIFQALSKECGIDLERPWRSLPAAHKKIVLYGLGEDTLRVRYEGHRGTGTWTMAFEGVLNAMMRRFTETKSAAMREHYLRYFSEAKCSACGGARLRPESTAVTVAGMNLVELTAMAVAELAAFFRALRLEGNAATIASELLKEIRGRLGFLEAVGLNYLTLDRTGPTLAGGEAQRIRLASQLGTELTGVLYILDEPSVGLHSRDTARLVKTLKRLRDAGNSVVVVEHDPATVESADHVIDLGPGAGERGGRVVFAGTPARLKRSRSLTGRYLSGKDRIEVPTARRKGKGALRIRGARENNLKNLDVALRLGAFTAVTGVSGAGKSSLVAGIVFPALRAKLHGAEAKPGDHDAIEGLEALDKVIHIDQSPIGRSPRSNPATYTGAFGLVRDVFAMLPESRMFGFRAGRFSFNVRGGRCEACEGDGVKKVRMHFLPDVYIPCEVCRGKRYNEATLRVRYKGLNVAEVLDLSVGRARDHFSAHPKLKRILDTLCDVGMEYVKLGQPATTLSGGEAQRVKLSKELSRKDTGRTLYILDEPTTGLHADDIRKLLAVLDRLVEAGNTVVVIEHNLDVIKCADRVLDLGPEGGEGGGRIVAEGTPEAVAKKPGSITGRYLKKALKRKTGP